MEKDDRAYSGSFELSYPFEELQKRAFKDELSGLLNRATMEQYIGKRLREMAPEETCALFIIDLDDFKKVNDTFGHQAGDQAIRKSASILSGIFRASDIIGRLGGDEFAVFMCGNVTEKVVREKGDAICANLQFVLGTLSIVSVTASVGIYLSGGGRQFESMYRSADLALYKAKKSGKHRICLKSDQGYYKEAGDDYQPVSALSLSGLLEYMDSGVALLEKKEKFQIIYISPSLCRLLNITLQEYPLPLNLSDLIYPDDVEPVENLLQEGICQGKTVEHIHRVAAGKGGGWLWCRIRAIRVKDEALHPVMMVTITDVSQFKDRERRLEEANQRLSSAFDYRSKRLWEVDLQTGDFVAFGQDGSTHVLEYGKERIPEGFIEDGWIHANSAERFRAFVQEILKGQSQGHGNFMLRNRGNHRYNWASLSYRVILDNVGHAVRAIGVAEDLSRSFQNQGVGNMRMHLISEGLIPDLTVGICANLTKDELASLWVEGQDLSSQIWQASCSQILLREWGKVIQEDRVEETAALFEREKLLGAFREGQRWLSAEYRRADGGGNIRWVRYVLSLTEDTKTHDIYLYAYLIRIDRRRRLEADIGREVRYDKVTGLYSRDTADRMAEIIFRGGGTRAVALLQVGGLSLQQGEKEALKIYRGIVETLILAFGESCILGQFCEDKIIMLFPAVVSKENLRRQIEEAVAFVRRAAVENVSGDSLRFVAGIAYQTGSYQKLLESALHVCEKYWNAAADMVLFTHEDEEWDWTQLYTGGQGDQVTIHSEEMERPLSVGEKEVAFDCISGMLCADSLGSSIHGVLKNLGDYYRADRVYILMLIENRQAVIMPYEWTSAKKFSIAQTVSGMRLDRFPLLKRCLSEQAPVFLTRTQPILLSTDEVSDEIWYFTTFPLIRDGHVDGFLCIENSREHPADAALFSTLIPYLLRERERFHAVSQEEGTVEQLMGLPDLRSYMETVRGVNSEKYSSMGVVCLDVPSIANINGSRGFEYGSKLLWYVAKTLTDVFGASMLFRTWEAEFIAFCPNTTEQVFLGKCGRLRSILQRRYPMEVRIGRAWSDGRFSGKGLVEEARGDGAGQTFNSHEALSGRQSNFYEKGPERFTIYFQPKVDMRSGSIFGAEILVRGLESDGTVVPPSGFIKAMEEDGSIRELDLFVLDRALAQLEQWRVEKKDIVPVSVNISRKTLFYPSALASVLAVQSRYPDVPADMLELEFTESAEGLEAEELRDIVDRFRACGFKISLDDFGSQYANLSLFTNVRFDAVKLDRSLITEVAENPVNQMLIQDIIRISRVCNMICVAEGVENQKQIDALLNAGCIYAQGYYYDRPMPAEEFEEKYLCGNKGCNP